MINANDYLKTSIERVEQLKNQKKSREKREQEAKRKMDIRRYIILGKLVCEYFPDLMRYQPQRNKVDTDSEFASFAKILRLVADDKELLAKLREEATKQTLPR